MRRIYLASSWSNPRQPEILAALRAAGHEVYDYRNPAPGNTGFAWDEVDPAWRSWDAETFRAALKHPIAEQGFNHDAAALDRADTVILLLPSGNDSHLELGWAAGQMKYTIVLLDEKPRAGLMYKLVDHLCTSFEEVLAALGETTCGVPGPRGRTCELAKDHGGAHECEQGCGVWLRWIARRDPTTWW